MVAPRSSPAGGPALTARLGGEVVRPGDDDYARSNDLPLGVRGGGHSPAGHGTIDGGLVLDLARMKRLDVDREQRVASAQAGLTWGEYNARTHVDGLATPGGDVATVGIAGLTLAGGMGWLMCKHGMTIDNLLEVDVVTADGGAVDGDRNGASRLPLKRQHSGRLKRTAPTTAANSEIPSSSCSTPAPSEAKATAP